jgi:hypothetical protein
MANLYQHADLPDMRFATTRTADPGTKVGSMLGITDYDFGNTMANHDEVND